MNDRQKVYTIYRLRVEGSAHFGPAHVVAVCPTKQLAEEIVEDLRNGSNAIFFAYSICEGMGIIPNPLFNENDKCKEN